MTLGILGALAIGQYAAAAVIVFFMRFADFLEGFTTERSRQAIRALLRLAPETARVEQDGREVEIPAEAVRPGQLVLVKPGERIPVDGRVADGHGAVNQAPITGESMPVEKHAGEHVFAATILERGAPPDRDRARRDRDDLRADPPARRGGRGPQGARPALRRPLYRVLHPRGRRGPRS